MVCICLLECLHPFQLPLSAFVWPGVTVVCHLYTSAAAAAAAGEEVLVRLSKGQQAPQPSQHPLSKPHADSSSR
jgi:hypothetical protein